MLPTTILSLLLLLTTQSWSSGLRLEGYLAPLRIHREIHNEYVVVFERGHTLEQHFSNIDLDLSNLAGFRRYNYGYRATLDDQTRDERVRRDKGVHSVETSGPDCGFVSNPEEVSKISDLMSLFSEHNGYLAPLEGMDYPDRFPDDYIVIFRKGHTLEEHFCTIGRDLSSSPSLMRLGFGYTVTMDDKTRDEQVRRDPGVRMVESDGPVYGIEPVEMVLLGDVDTASIASEQMEHRSLWLPEIV